ncbi:MAG TPA: VWA domain-containing protein [Bryobacteraceae bacterium]|nr:VWA domain-containing protein [Bryobacteraceae bacterium]
MRLRIAALALATGILLAQMPEPIIRTTTRLVQINVIATKGGAPVPGLKKEDFQVFDNGKRQEIRQFSEETRAMLPSASAPLPQGTFTNQLEQRSGTPAAVTAILLDGVNTRFSDQTAARKQVVQFLKQIQPEDRIAIYTLDSRGLRVLHDYTTDSSDLVAKLAKYQGDIAPDVTGGSALIDPLGGWLGSGGDSYERAFFLNDRILQTLHAIEYIAQNLAPLPGRKNLIWVSSAFPLQVGFFGSGGGGGGGRAGGGGRSGPTGMSPSSFPRQQQTWTADAAKTIRALNDANLAIYPVDARGLVASASSRVSSRVYVNQSTMEELASRTGGRAFTNTNDIAGAIRTAVEDSAVTYTLGFYPQNDKFDNSFHNLKVKLVDFPHLDLRYRKGYVDQSTPPQDEGLRRQALRDAVLSPMDANGIGLRADVHQTSAGFDLTLRVDPKSILLDPQGGRWAGKLDLLFVEKDAHGAQTYGVDDTMALELKQQSYDRIQKEGLVYHRVLPATGQASEIRVVVRDTSTGAVGSITAPLNTIPSQP